MLIVLIAVVLIILVMLAFKYPMIPLGIFLMISFIKGILMLNFSIFQTVDLTVLEMFLCYPRNLPEIAAESLEATLVITTSQVRQKTGRSGTRSGVKCQ